MQLKLLHTNNTGYFFNKYIPGTLADISQATFIDNSKGQEVRVSKISLEVPVANEETTEPVQFVESCNCLPDRNVQGMTVHCMLKLKTKK